jgi:Gpi18-like mannosyltransferase
MPLAPDLVAGLVANGLSIVALVLWARVLERSFSRSTARHGLALLAFSPSAFVLSMGYSEPLFLLVGALFFMSTKGGRARPLMAVLAVHLVA